MGPGAIVALSSIVIVASFVQGSGGFGFALIATPIIGIVQADLLPATTLALMIPLNAYIAYRERQHIDFKGVGWVSAARIPGTVGGLILLAAIPAAGLNIVIGAATILAGLASLIVPKFEASRLGLLGAGAITGVVETATGVGGPPLAIVFQHRPAPTLRSTIAACFLIGEIVSLGLLLATGQAHPNQMLAAATLLPALIVGSAASHFVHHRIGGPRLRIAVLLFAVISGVVLLLKALLA